MKGRRKNTQAKAGKHVIHRHAGRRRAGGAARARRAQQRVRREEWDGPETGTGSGGGGGVFLRVSRTKVCRFIYFICGPKKPGGDQSSNAAAQEGRAPRNSKPFAPKRCPHFARRRGPQQGGERAGASSHSASETTSFFTPGGGPCARPRRRRAWGCGAGSRARPRRRRARRRRRRAGGA